MNTSMIIMSVILAVCVVLLPFVINGILRDIATSGGRGKGSLRCVYFSILLFLTGLSIGVVKQGNYYAPYIAALTMPILPWLIAYRLKGFRENRETISFIHYFVFEIIVVFAALALFI